MPNSVLSHSCLPLQALPARNVRCRTYGARYERATQPLRRHRDRGQGWRLPSRSGRVCRGSRAGRIEQGRQRRERARPGRSSAWSPWRRRTGPQPWPSPWRSCPTRSGVRPRRPAAERTLVADLVRGLVEPGVPVVPGAARPAPQRHMAHAPAAFGGFPGRVADARQPRDFLRHTGSKRMPVRTALGFVGEEWCRHPMIMP